ncbi:isochorismatase family protein [Streptomyces sp. NPDC058623]|uniref:isochorismatase family protein n=1 Tax=Streptomyces sp. NPDC058623 TaxID=3346563 RepID=UPI00365F1618
MAGIPPIERYPMPGPGDLPASRLHWTADPDRAVLLVHDMQRYFLRPFPSGSPRDELVSNTARLRQRCVDLNIPVAYSMQPGSMTAEERGLVADLWGPGMAATQGDREVVEPLAPQAGDWRFTKWRYSAFFRTELLARMREHGRDQLLLCGVYAHLGVLLTAADAYNHDIQAFLVADSVADFSAADHRQALDYAARACAMVTTTETVLSQLPELRPARTVA